MTDKQTLFTYRLKLAEETLLDAKNMLQNNLSSRSIVNRIYYSMFYAILAIFLKSDINIKTSKHSGVISLFDKEFVHTGKIDKLYSKNLHKLFNARIDGDYKDFAEFSKEGVSEFIKLAEEFLREIKRLISID